MERRRLYHKQKIKEEIVGWTREGNSIGTTMFFVFGGASGVGLEREYMLRRRRRRMGREPSSAPLRLSIDEKPLYIYLSLSKSSDNLLSLDRLLLCAKINVSCIFLFVISSPHTSGVRETPWSWILCTSIATWNNHLFFFVLLMIQDSYSTKMIHRASTNPFWPYSILSLDAEVFPSPSP